MMLLMMLSPGCRFRIHIGQRRGGSESMREILFKAKRKDNGEWIEGYYIYHIRRTICPFGDSVKPEDEQHVIMQDGFSDWNMPRDTVFFNIDPKTICQYTGLKDKNGNRIWENDIVRIENSMDEGIGNVEFYGSMWYVDGEPNNNLYDIVEYDDGEVEVIGNIFDNPELLGQDGE